jgi:hypothetical protein
VTPTAPRRQSQGARCAGTAWAMPIAELSVVVIEFKTTEKKNFSTTPLPV